MRRSTAVICLRGLVLDTAVPSGWESFPSHAVLTAHFWAILASSSSQYWKLTEQNDNCSGEIGRGGNFISKWKPFLLRCPWMPIKSLCSKTKWILPPTFSNKRKSKNKIVPTVIVPFQPTLVNSRSLID